MSVVKSTVYITPVDKNKGLQHLKAHTAELCASRSALSLFAKGLCAKFVRGDNGIE